MDLFIVLGLEHGASEGEVRRAYRRLARRFHPDINPGDRVAEARFREILEAYETLIDPERRSRYEAGQGPPPVGVPGSGFEGFDFSKSGADHAVTFGDLFGEVLSERRSRAQRPERGADLHHEIQVSFEESFTGTTRAVTLTRRETCRNCAGDGRSRTPAVACALCAGAGSTRSVRGHMVFTRRCTGCGGTGQQRPRACESCGGSGFETRAGTLEVRIPAGVADGDTVRLEARGNTGARGGSSGDLYLRVRVTPHPDFRREGDDLHCVLNVGIHEAALGARVPVGAPDGTVRLRMPPGTQSGQRFRVSGRGMPSARGEGRGDRRGDLIVEVRLRLPAVLDERSKELLREFGRIHGESARPAEAGASPGEATS
jgi:molecular chaperone DnaJ